MDIAYILIITLTLLFLLILLGVHVGVSLALMSVLGIFLSTNDIFISLSILETTAFRSIREYIYGVIPLFVLMGLLANMSGASEELYNSFDVLLRRISGGLGMATVGANALFAAITGVSVASAAVFSKVSLKPMTDLNYNKKFALGTIAGSSVLGMLIPPSLLLIIYGMLAQQSIGALFIAGIVPGLMLAFIYCIGIYIMAKTNPSLIGRENSTKTNQIKFNKNDIKILFKPWGIILLILVVLGGIYGGVFTPTEAGGIGAFGALLLVIFKKRFSLKGLWSVLLETGYTTSSVLFLLITAQMYSRMLSMSGIGGLVNNFIDSLNVPNVIILIVCIAIILLLGTILDSTSIILVTMPLMLPIIMDLDYNLIWFGIIVVISVEVGLLTPPFGMVVYSMKSALGNRVTIEEIFIGSFPFIIMMLFALVILILFPNITIWLPSLM